MNKSIDKHFVSEIDKFLEEQRKRIPQSESQRQECSKYNIINYLRDNVVEEKEEIELWENF